MLLIALCSLLIAGWLAYNKQLVGQSLPWFSCGCLFLFIELLLK